MLAGSVKQKRVRKIEKERKKIEKKREKLADGEEHHQSRTIEMSSKMVVARRKESEATSLLLLRVT